MADRKEGRQEPTRVGDGRCAARAMEARFSQSAYRGTGLGDAAVWSPSPCGYSSVKTTPKIQILPGKTEGKAQKPPFPPMTIAVVADIHANLPALEAVLADARHRGVGGFLCLGVRDEIGHPLGVFLPVFPQNL